MATKDYLAQLVVKDFSGREVRRIDLRDLSKNYVEKVMRGMLINMSEDYYIDATEVDKARKLLEKQGKPIKFTGGIVTRTRTY